MSDFEFNHSIIDEKYRILLSQNMISALRAHARVILVPFFRELCIQHYDTEGHVGYPTLTPLCERIIESLFEGDELEYEALEEAEEMAIDFIEKLKGWQKTCLALYFCSGAEFLDQSQEEKEDDNEQTIEQMYIQEGLKIKEAVLRMTRSDVEIAGYLMKELIHIQDIFSTEDISYWDASSIVNANENFEQYAGKGQVLIPITLNERDHWEKLMGGTAREDNI